MRTAWRNATGEHCWVVMGTVTLDNAGRASSSSDQGVILLPAGDRCYWRTGEDLAAGLASVLYARVSGDGWLPVLHDSGQAVSFPDVPNQTGYWLWMDTRNGQQCWRE